MLDFFFKNGTSLNLPLANINVPSKVQCILFRPNAFYIQTRFPLSLMWIKCLWLNGFQGGKLMKEATENSCTCIIFSIKRYSIFWSIVVGRRGLYWACSVRGMTLSFSFHAQGCLSVRPPARPPVRPPVCSRRKAPIGIMERPSQATWKLHFPGILTPLTHSGSNETYSFNWEYLCSRIKRKRHLRWRAWWMQRPGEVVIRF